ncbi:glycoside hydrolase superfamily [Obelidium mucronatum]|nr:glycoside hydrolase superfamily [Obelidium mucronatum]
MGVGRANCIGNIAKVDSIPGFNGLCLQDGSMGVTFTENVTAFPSGLNAAATFDRALILEYATALGAEFRYLGANVALGPMMNLVRAPTGGRNWEGPGGDPYLASVSASLIVRGIQSNGVIAAAKHFIANEQEHFRHTSSSNVDKRTLMELYLPPFEACVREGVGAVMCGYNKLNQVYACQNSDLIDGILKKELGFRGFVVTDWGAAYSLLVSDMIMSGGQPILSHTQQEQNGNTTAEAMLTKAVTLDNLPESRLNEMVSRILTSYYKMGQDQNYPDHNDKISSWTTPRAKNVYNYEYRFKHHAELARRVATASTILVKNEKEGGLPIVIPDVENGEDGKIKIPEEAPTRVFKIAVLGEDARLPTILNEYAYQAVTDGTLGQGWGSGTEDYPYLISPLEGITNRVSELKHVEVASSVDNDELENVRETAETADIAIVFANANSGEELTVEGNQGDRNDLKLWHDGDALIEAVASVNKRTIVVLHTVGAVEMKWINHPNITAVIYALLPGQESGAAIAQVLFGDVNPSGRLPFTIHKERKDYAADVLYDSTDETPQINYTEGLYIDYMHSDKFNITPLFPFGHGLSYTQFRYSQMKIYQADVKDPWGDVTVQISVENIGSVHGHEVVQLYVGNPKEAKSPVKQLKGFEKVWIEAGGVAIVRIVVKKRDVRVWHEGWTNVGGEYVFYAGASSGDIRLQTVHEWGIGC